jgi:CDGSH-type Zn-finger protein
MQSNTIKQADAAPKQQRPPSLLVLNQEEMDEMYADENKIPPKANIAKPHYMRVKMQKGETYEYCTCGFSKEQPFCDKTCQNSGDTIQGWKPMKLQPTVQQTQWPLCCCKRTKSHTPICDGSHIDIDDW